MLRMIESRQPSLVKCRTPDEFAIAESKTKPFSNEQFSRFLTRRPHPAVDGAVHG
jgi:hypothetical protein